MHFGFESGEAYRKKQMPRGSAVVACARATVSKLASLAIFFIGGSYSNSSLPCACVQCADAADATVTGVQVLRDAVIDAVALFGIAVLLGDAISHVLQGTKSSPPAPPPAVDFRTQTPARKRTRRERHGLAGGSHSISTHTSRVIEAAPFYRVGTGASHHPQARTRNRTLLAARAGASKRAMGASVARAKNSSRGFGGLVNHDDSYGWFVNAPPHSILNKVAGRVGRRVVAAPRWCVQPPAADAARRSGPDTARMASTCRASLFQRSKGSDTRSLDAFLAAAGLAGQAYLTAGGRLTLVSPRAPRASRLVRRISLRQFGSTSPPERSGFGPRYFTVLDVPADTPGWAGTSDSASTGVEWSADGIDDDVSGGGSAGGSKDGRGGGRDGSVLLLARAQPTSASAGQLATMLFAAKFDPMSGMRGPLRLWGRAVATGDVGHNLGALFVPTSDAAGRAYGHASADGGRHELIAIGGQFHPSRKLRWRQTKARLDGVYLLRARNQSELLTRAFFPFQLRGWATRAFRTPAQEERVCRVLDGYHEGCAECRAPSQGACEFDGRFSLARFRGRYHLYARANLQTDRGGRFLQVASTSTSNPRGPYGPFARLRIAGHAYPQAGNLYFGAVKPNPLDASVLIGLFTLALPPGAGARPLPTQRTASTDEKTKEKRQRSASGSEHNGLVALSVSCDGLHWGPLVVLTTGLAVENRSFDQPCDGLIHRGGRVLAFVHRNVPGICKQWDASPEIEAHALDNGLLRRLSLAAHKTLPGC